MEIENVSTIMSKDVITLSPEETLFSAIVKMNQNNVSCIVIVQDNKPEGILTERDIIYLKGNNIDFNLVTLKTVMRSPVIAVSEDTDIPEVANLMVINSLRRLVVVDNNHKVTGIVTQTDIIKNLRIDSFVNLKKVEQVMNRTIISVTEEEHMNNVISLMAENKISCVLVKKNSKPIGIITERIITKTIANNILPPYVHEIMIPKVVTASKDINLYDATKLIDENMVRCLIITDDNGDAVGIITKSDIIKNLRADYITILKNMLKQKSQALIESELKYRTLVEQSLEGIMIIQDGIIKFINPTLLKILNYYQKDMLGEDILRFLYPDSRALFSEYLKKLESNKSIDSPLEIRMLSKNDKGLYMEVLLTQIPYEGKHAVLITLRDITERKKTEAELKRLVITDDLTGLFNQRYFYTIIVKEIERAKRHNRQLSLMLIDIDFFKDFNDRYGHWEGDYVLKKIADIISKSIRDIDMAFRYGGEEFTILLPETTHEEAIIVAERIRKSVSETVFHPFTLDGELEIVKKTVSIGLTELNPYDDMKSFIVRADNAMYQAKKSGRNKIVHLL